MKPRPHPLPKGKPEAPRRFQTITIAQARRQFARVLADVGRVASWRLWTARAAPSLPCWIPAHWRRWKSSPTRKPCEPFAPPKPDAWSIARWKKRTRNRPPRKRSHASAASGDFAHVRKSSRLLFFQCRREVHLGRGVRAAFLCVTLQVGAGLARALPRFYDRRLRLAAACRYNGLPRAKRFYEVGRVDVLSWFTVRE